MGGSEAHNATAPCIRAPTQPLGPGSSAAEPCAPLHSPPPPQTTLRPRGANRAVPHLVVPGRAARKAGTGGSDRRLPAGPAPAPIPNPPGTRRRATPDCPQGAVPSQFRHRRPGGAGNSGGGGTQNTPGFVRHGPRRAPARSAPHRSPSPLPGPLTVICPLVASANINSVRDLRGEGRGLPGWIGAKETRPPALPPAAPRPPAPRPPRAALPPKPAIQTDKKAVGLAARRRAAR